MNKKYPSALTSYDLIKSLAVILMICDHIGYFFYPDEMWFRTLGRLCLPIWFFLIGYAKTDSVPKSFWVGGGIVAASSLIAGQYLMPLNILFTMAFLRIYRAGVIRHSLVSGETLRGMFLILFFLGFPSGLLVEYGALAMLIVLAGVIVRNKEEVYKNIKPKHALMYFIAAFFAMFITQGVAMPYLDERQALVMVIGYVMLGFILWRFKPMVFIDANRYIAGSIIKFMQFMGRWTLEIYVVHLVVLHGVAMYMFPERFGFLQWHYVHDSVLKMFL